MHEKVMRKSLQSLRAVVQKSWEIHEKFMRKSWESHKKKSWLSPLKFMRNSWVGLKKIMRKSLECVLLNSSCSCRLGKLICSCLFIEIWLREAILKKNLLLFGQDIVKIALTPAVLDTYEELCRKKCTFLIVPWTIWIRVGPRPPPPPPILILI